MVPPVASYFLLRYLSVAALLSTSLFVAVPLLIPQTATPQSYLGFDRNVYPGDAALPVLRKTFTFSSYWLSPPPGEKINTWLGKHELLRSQGFGFLVLYRGRESKEVESSGAAMEAGIRDGKNAVAVAKSEGFPSDIVIFLDIEEGGRLPSNYLVYLVAWFEELTRAGYHPGIYCSGMPVDDGPGVTITTAGQIRGFAKLRDITFWIYNDFCPPSPGCATPAKPPAPSTSGIGYAAVWQFAQSPRRKKFTARCPAKYAADGNCYAPGDAAHDWLLDLNTATSPDPSGGAR